MGKLTPRNTKGQVTPMSDNTLNYIYYETELEFEGETLRPGDKIRIKGERGIFTYRGWAHNAKTDVTWVDCTEDSAGSFRAFYIERIKSVIRPKKSRRKKSQAT